MPDNVRHSVIKAKSSGDKLIRDVSQMVIGGIIRGVWKCVHIICATRDDATNMLNKMTESNPAISVSADILRGGDPVDEFIPMWLGGDLQVAITTSLGIQSLNNTHCDCVVQVNTVFGIINLFQAVMRAGRDGSNAESIFVWAPKHFNRLKDGSGVAYNMACYKAAGIDVENPLIQKLLRYDSAMEYLEEKTKTVSKTK